MNENEFEYKTSPARSRRAQRLRSARVGVDDIANRVLDAAASTDDVTSTDDKDAAGPSVRRKLQRLISATSSKDGIPSGEQTKAVQRTTALRHTSRGLSINGANGIAHAGAGAVAQRLALSPAQTLAQMTALAARRLVEPQDQNPQSMSGALGDVDADESVKASPEEIGPLRRRSLAQRTVAPDVDAEVSVYVSGTGRTDAARQVDTDHDPIAPPLLAEPGKMNPPTEVSRVLARRVSTSSPNVSPISPTGFNSATENPIQHSHRVAQRVIGQTQTRMQALPVPPTLFWPKLAQRKLHAQATESWGSADAGEMDDRADAPTMGDLGMHAMDIGDAPDASLGRAVSDVMAAPELPMPLVMRKTVSTMGSGEPSSASAAEPSLMNAETLMRAALGAPAGSVVQMNRSTATLPTEIQRSALDMPLPTASKSNVVQRVITDDAEPTNFQTSAVAAEDGNSVVTPRLPELDDLARRVYPLIKRLIAMERERMRSF